MHRLTIRQQNHSQESVFHLFNRRPAPNTPILLHRFLYGALNHPLDPFITNDSAVWPLTNELEVPGALHRILFTLALRHSDLAAIWRQADELNESLISRFDPGDQTPSVLAPTASEPRTYRFKLRVTDKKGADNLPAFVDVVGEP